MRCLLPALLAALNGAPPAHPYLLTPPPQLANPPPRAPTRSGERAICGNNYPFHQETEHFTLQWSDPAAPQDRVDEIAARIEEAWTYYADQGWQMPPYADTCYLWFILDTTISGSGYTTLYTSGDFPEGYPVTFLHPTYIDDDYPGFAVSVAVHEFAHMLQFTVEDYYAHADRTWYWEASAEWMAEKSAPDLDWYADSTYWYADAPEASYDSVINFHQYGMLGLNAWIDASVGFDAITEAWQTAAQHDEPWDLRLARATGQDFSILIADFSGAYAADSLPESDLYYPPLREDTHRGTPAPQTLDLPDLYGTHYIDIQAADAPLAWEGDVIARFVQDGAWSDTPPESGDYTAAFTAVSPDTAGRGTYRYGRADQLDGPDDTGDPDSGDPDDPGGKDNPSACAASPAAPALLARFWPALLALLPTLLTPLRPAATSLLARRRRR